MNGNKILSNIKYYTDYSKWDAELNRKQTWDERVPDVIGTHKNNPELSEKLKKPHLAALVESAENAYINKLVLGSQRALQFPSEHIYRHNSKIYNCTVSYCDRPRVFQEWMYQLLCGCGVGISFLKKYVNKLPLIEKRTKGTKTFIIPDSIEGWSDAVGVLMSSYFSYDSSFPEYEGYVIHFDYSLIRPEGSLISGGFKAPGHKGLKKALEKIEALLEKSLNNHEYNLNPIIPYDILMFCADAVLSGGVRRSATIALFDVDDEDMMNAKTGNWMKENPQRARSNISALLIRNQTTKEQFNTLFNKTKEFGEPGFIWTDSDEFVFNPCVEIGMLPSYDGVSGWQSCNLTEINGSKCTTKEIFLEACKASAVLGTIQASYTSLPYLGETSELIHKREALLGCSITGFMNNPKILLNPEILKEGARIIKETNKITAEMIGINQAARVTCVKPSGNASVLLETASGCHGEHSPNYFRIIQMNKQDDISKFLNNNYPEIIEESVWSENNTDYAVFIPVKSKSSSIYKKDLLGIKQLEYVKLIQQSWVEEGTNVELCVHPKLRHNVSNTISVENWDETADYIYNNKEYFAGISLLSNTGDKIYNQAPFTEVIDSKAIIEKYGDVSMFVSGLIVDALHLFNDNLWDACISIVDDKYEIEGTRNQVLLKKDWIQRAKKFGRKYFKSLDDLTYCMKDVHLYHKWVKIEKQTKNLNIEPMLQVIKPEYIDIDTLGAISCHGGSCEIF
jgi:ribonucleoside-triphosphate reductase (thioredoxin)